MCRGTGPTWTDLLPARDELTGSGEDECRQREPIFAGAPERRVSLPKAARIPECEIRRNRGNTQHGKGNLDRTFSAAVRRVAIPAELRGRYYGLC